MEIHMGKKYIGSISDDSMPALYNWARELGFSVNIKSEEGVLQLNPGLYNKHIIIFQDQKLKQNSLRNESYEQKIVKTIQQCLSQCGAQVKLALDEEPLGKTALQISVNLFQIPRIKQSMIELYHASGIHDVKWINLIKKECKKLNIKVAVHELDNPENREGVKIHVMIPTNLHGSEWEIISEQMAHILSIGLICKLHDVSGISPFSILSVNALINLLSSDTQTINQAVSEQEGKLIEGEIEQNTPANDNNSITDAQAFFDYHLMINQANSENLKVIGNLIIKNTGTVPLRNPFICLRVSPAGSIRITGQILPPNVASTKGLQTVQGARGWQYIKENWFEEAEEKGELWIRSINDLVIGPDEVVSLSNLQMRLTDIEEDKKLTVEAFVLFNDNGMQMEANNKISLLLNSGRHIEKLEAID
ncbi:hypothetical protein [Robertmurraya andreesenii]|uniref:Uncharacterized protein n=1 Tax=Anoxybacillus andreesenii TaxID=1325932 RepID=A0ABT9V8S5_9BACL|nr:hypothetical protein [Robertmurraya andreesenii]MDQ0157340.1 hypothetical protein [Robertmurraya andreesenii]